MSCYMHSIADFVLGIIMIGNKEIYFYTKKRYWRLIANTYKKKKTSLTQLKYIKIAQAVSNGYSLSSLSTKYVLLPRKQKADWTNAGNQEG